MARSESHPEPVSSEPTSLDLTASVGQVVLKNPIVAASGTFGYGLESAELLDLNALGGFVTKGLSLQPKQGNPSPRLWETPSGLINSIGLENPGLDVFIDEYLPRLKDLDCALVVNFFGATRDDYFAAAERLDGLEGVAAVEMNLSCPNVKTGGLTFGSDPAVARQLVAGCRQRYSGPLWVKLGIVGPVTDLARAVVEAGADALCVGNTIPAMAIDPWTRRPKLGAVSGGLSGPAIHPVAVKAVFSIARLGLGVPIVGIGGVRQGLDAVEFLLAGASAVQVGTQNLVEPAAPLRIAEEVASYCRRVGVSAVSELIGAVRLD